MKLKTTLLAAAATLLVAPAANAYQGFYGAIGAGLNYMEPDRDFSNTGPDGAGPFLFDTSTDSKEVSAFTRPLAMIGATACALSWNLPIVQMTFVTLHPIL